MALRSRLFTSDDDEVVKTRLRSCLDKDSEHIQIGARGKHVSKIQTALFILLPGLKLPDNELSDPVTGDGFYGQGTAAAVLRYKKDHKPPIINTAYQDKPDSIVGRMTIQFLDDDMFAKEQVDPLKPPPVDKSIRTLTLWLNAFIGKDVKNSDGTAMSFSMTKGSHSGESAIPGPFTGRVLGFDDCYLTDQRNFDPFNKNASSRIHAEVKIDFTGSAPTFILISPFGATVETVRLRISTGEELNRGRGVARGGFIPISGFETGSKVVTMQFNIAGNNPIAKMPRILVVPPVPVPIPLVPSRSDPPVPFDPDIDMKGEFTIDAQNRTLKFRGFIDGFPFFEGYVVADAGSPITIFQKEPEPGQSPLTGLPGPPKIPIDVDKSIP